MRYHTFRGIRFTVLFDDKGLESDEMGICENPRGVKNPKVVIKPGMPLKDTMRTALHEAIHACFWDLTEEAVTNAEEDIGRFLDRVYDEWHKRNKK